MVIYYWESPHRQIQEDFFGRVVKVHDGDTIKVQWSEREKPVTVRLAQIAAPELDEEGGIKSKEWLRNQIEDEYVQIKIDRKLRVGKWGRILGKVFFQGMDINEMSREQGKAIRFGGKEQWL